MRDIDIDQIIKIERCSMNGLPAIETIDLGGWTIRFSDGYTNRGNSVNPISLLTPCTPHPPSPLLQDVEKRIDECERLFQARELFPLFKLTKASFPDDLEDILSDRGYIPHKPRIHIKTKSMNENLGDRFKVGRESDQAVEESDGVTFHWLMSFARMNHMEPVHVSILSRLLQRIGHPSKFITIRDMRGGVEIEKEGEKNSGKHEKIVACGYGVVEDGYLGLFDILVDETFQRKGYGMQVMNHLMTWGKEQGAVTAYLQVIDSNEPALRMYKKLGFETLYDYWYRIKPID